jgi:hypothetical protein
LVRAASFDAIEIDLSALWTARALPPSPARVAVWDVRLWSAERQPV